MKVLVTGGTGVVGRQLVTNLQRRNVEVRVVTRKAPERHSQRASETEFFVGDLLDPCSMRDALKGIDKLFLLNPVTAEELTQSLIVLGMATRADLQHVTYLSVLAAERFPDVPHFATKLAVETALRQSKIPHTIVRPGFYFQNDLGLRDSILEAGVYPLPIGSRGISGTDIRDIAEAAAITLTNAGHEGQTYSVVSSAPITGPGNAELWGRLLNREARYAGHDFGRFEEQMRAYTSNWEAYDMREMFEGFHERGFVAPNHEIERFTKLLNRLPRTYEQFASDTAAHWLSETR
jgi:uncharacterized protein YbjT (DUF2867 family)